MDHRQVISEKLHKIIGSEVYFEPPESVKIKDFPAIIYKFSGYEKKQADDGRYFLRERYNVLHIYLKVHEQRRTEFMDKFPYCSFDRTYVADGLHHDSYVIYI